MKNPKRVTQVSYPQTIQKLGNGSYYYNYDIQSTLISNQNKDQEEQIQGYSFIQVLIQGQPDYKDCVQAIIRTYLTTDEEFDLVNSYNSYQNQLIEDESVVSDYMEYLNLLKEIKLKVKLDFNK